MLFTPMLFFLACSFYSCLFSIVSADGQEVVKNLINDVVDQEIAPNLTIKDILNTSSVSAECFSKCMFAMIKSVLNRLPQMDIDSSGKETSELGGLLDNTTSSALLRMFCNTVFLQGIECYKKCPQDKYFAMLNSSLFQNKDLICEVTGEVFDENKECLQETLTQVMLIDCKEQFKSFSVKQKIIQSTLDNLNDVDQMKTTFDDGCRSTTDLITCAMAKDRKLCGTKPSLVASIIMDAYHMILDNFDLSTRETLPDSCRTLKMMRDPSTSQTLPLNNNITFQKSTCPCNTLSLIKQIVISMFCLALLVVIF